MKAPPDREPPPPALDPGAVTRALTGDAELWREVRVVAETGSTNADLLAAARAGAGEGLVLAAEVQTAGRGRMGRRWSAPPRAALTFSVLLRPVAVPPGSLGWIPLLAGVAVTGALRGVAAVDAGLKWPNDVLIGGAKVAGILAEAHSQAVVVGIGINVSQPRAVLPVAGATSLALAAPAPPGRDRLLAAILGELARWYTAWRDGDIPGDPDRCGLRAEYVARCATLGREVTVSLPGQEAVTGTACGIDPAGRLQVSAASGLVAVSAGDVVHVR